MRQLFSYGLIILFAPIFIVAPASAASCTPPDSGCIPCGGSFVCARPPGGGGPIVLNQPNTERSGASSRERPSDERNPSRLDVPLERPRQGGATAR